MFATLLITIFLSFSFLFAVAKNEKENYELRYLSNNIFIDSLKLRSNIVIIKSNTPIKEFTANGKCAVSWKIIWKKWELYIWQILVWDKSCKQKRLQVSLKINSQIFEKKYNLVSEYDLYTINLDRTDKTLTSLIDTIDYKVEEIKNEKSLEVYRELKEINYMKSFLESILEKRKRKYKIPILDGKLPKKLNKIPNAWRPYRKDYTDGIHHWWDFDAEKWDAVIALDDGIIIRVVKDFKFSDLWNIKKSKQLTNNEKTKNLDILRGNQIWLKTMKWDVAFYSHLDTVFDDIEVGKIVSRWQALGTIGITWVPDKNYNDYHLHIPIHKNEYKASKVWKNTYLDYMNWDWYFKWKTLEYILQHQEKVFEK